MSTLTTFENADIGEVTLDRKLNWKTHSDLMRPKAFSALSRSFSLLKSTLLLRSKLLIYKSYIRPQMTYATPAWAFISKTKMNSLQVVQNRALRIIGGYDWYTGTKQIHSDNEISMLKAYIKILAKKLYAFAKLSSNRYIN